MDGGCFPEAQSVAKSWIAVLLLDGFSSLSLGGITEPFALLQQQLPDATPSLRVIGLSSPSVRSASGIEVSCEMDGDDLSTVLFTSGAPMAIIVCGPTHTQYCEEKSTIALLRKAKRSGVALFGVGRIAWGMADAGLLKGRDATVHWKSLAAFAESCQMTDTRNALFVTDESGGSCAGELATLDMTINMIAAWAPEAATEICNQLLVSHPRKGSTAQPGSQQERLRHVPGMLSRAAQIMAREIENPLNGSRIAAECGISVRQLERLFRRHLGTTPLQYYTALRVERSLELVSQTNLSLQEIAFAAGFTSVGTFSKKFKLMLGITPTQLRQTSKTVTGRGQGQWIPACA